MNLQWRRNGLIDFDTLLSIGQIICEPIEGCAGYNYVLGKTLQQRATSSSAGCPHRKTPTPLALAWRKRSRIIFPSSSNHSCFPLVAMLQSRLGTRTKTSETRVVAVYLPLYQAVTAFRKWSTEFCSDCVSIDRLSDRVSESYCFLTFINDLPQSLTCECSIFADDKHCLHCRKRHTADLP